MPSCNPSQVAYVYDFKSAKNVLLFPLIVFYKKKANIGGKKAFLRHFSFDLTVDNQITWATLCFYGMHPYRFATHRYALNLVFLVSKLSHHFCDLRFICYLFLGFQPQLV